MNDVPLRQRKFLTTLLSFLSMQACTLFNNGAKSKGEAPGPTLNYFCDLGALTQQSQPVTISFSWYQPSKSKGQSGRILVSDGAFENSPAALILIVDPSIQRIEQAKNLQGIPLESSMTSQYLDKNTSLQLYYLRLSEFVLSSAAKASKPEKAANGPAYSDFLFESRTFKVTQGSTIDAPYQYGKLSKEIVTDKNQKVCELK
jgi:hypothetical protein